MKFFQASMYANVLRKYNKLFPNDRLNVLLSIAHNEGERKDFMETYRNMIDQLIGDSGAWSVAQGNSDLTLIEVITFLQMFGDLFNYYFNFDTDFSLQGFAHNLANQRAMERAGLKPVPVIHNFFTDEIEYYVKCGKYDRIALGSSQSTNFDDIRYAVDKIKKWGNPNIRVHWFGGGKFDWLVRLPIASCDSTSWAMTGKFGGIRYWNPDVEKLNKTHDIYVGGRTKALNEDEYHFVNYPWRRELEEYLHKTFEFDYRDLLVSGSGYDNMQIVNTRFYADLEKRINEERERRGVELE
jgi:hypothetical protein